MTGKGNEEGSDWGQGGSREIKPEPSAKSAVPDGAGENAVICLCYQCGYRMLEEPGCLCRKMICPKCGGDMAWDT